MNRIPSDARSTVLETLHLPRLTPAHKRSLLTRKNLLRTTIDEIELLAESSKYAVVVTSLRYLIYYSSGCR